MDCRARDLVGTVSQGAIIFPGLREQGWVAQRIDSKEQSLLYICQLNPCPRQQGSDAHPWAFPAAAVLDPGAPAAGKRLLLRLPCPVPALDLHPGAGGGTQSCPPSGPRDSLGMALADCPQRCQLQSALPPQRCSSCPHQYAPTAAGTLSSQPRLAAARDGGVAGMGPHKPDQQETLAASPQPLLAILRNPRPRSWCGSSAGAHRASRGCRG